MTSLVNEASEMFSIVAAEKSIELSRTIPQSSATVVCERELLLRVFSNLIGNAIKFTPTKGAVSVVAELRAGMVHFSIIDTDPGIPADHLAHIFDRYWQQRDSDRRGSGLGLCIAKGIVEAHGGRTGLVGRNTRERTMGGAWQPPQAALTTLGVKSAPEETYDARYRHGYREKRTGYEVARAAALRHFIVEVARVGAATRVLDYGSGSGLHVDLWEEVFPQARLSFTDISSVALDALAARHPKHASAVGKIDDGRAPFDGGVFDVVVSVEVLEHVVDLDGYLRDILRLLRPGGTFVWTTPCGNRGSIEHLVSRGTGQVERTSEGYRRWSWEDPTHLRRMRTAELTARMVPLGFQDPVYRMRSHLFSWLCSSTPLRRAGFVAERLMLLDYSLFRRFPNGASMLGATQKR